MIRIQRNKIIILITILGAILRFWDLGENPLWIDEVCFAFFIKSGSNQELIPVWIGQLFGFHSEFWLRFQSAFFGTLTIPAIYYVLKKNNWSALCVAVFPLFVFWSRMARPFAVAGFFLVLSWRWWWLMIPAVMTYPVAIIGIIKHKWYIVASFIVVGLVFYLIREDSGRNWTIEQILNSPRWFYLPALTAILLVSDIILPYLNKRFLVPKGSNVHKRLEKRKKR